MITTNGGRCEFPWAIGSFKINGGLLYEGHELFDLLSARVAITTAGSLTINASTFLAFQNDDLLEIEMI